MKELLKDLLREFEWEAFWEVGLILTGGCLLVIALVASLINASWSPLLLLVPGILCLAIAAGVAF